MYDFCREKSKVQNNITDVVIRIVFLKEKNIIRIVFSPSCSSLAYHPLNGWSGSKRFDIIVPSNSR